MLIKKYINNKGAAFPPYPKERGIYAIILKQDSILLIKKNRGSYKGKFDLPGGKPEYRETPTETLIREILEETGVKTESMSLFDNYSTITCELFPNSLQ